MELLLTQLKLSLYNGAMRIRIVITFWFLIGLSATGFAAETFEGLIQINQGHLILVQSGTNAQLPLGGATDSIVQDLARMRPGDFLSSSGTWLAERSVLNVETINFVGLRNIIGAWHTDDWQVFDFKSFTQLSLYRMAPPPNAMIPNNQNYDYAIIPDIGGKWALMLADNKNVHIGSLEIRERVLSIKIIDSATGRVSESLTLSPVYTRTAP